VKRRGPPLAAGRGVFVGGSWSAGALVRRREVWSFPYLVDEILWKERGGGKISRGGEKKESIGKENSSPSEVFRGFRRERGKRVLSERGLLPCS